MSDSQLIFATVLRTVLLLFTLEASGTRLAAQSDLFVRITGGSSPALAVSEFRGQQIPDNIIEAFNTKLWRELQDSGALNLVPRNLFPALRPQTPEDLRGALQPWSRPPCSASFLAFGYAGVANGRLVVFGWLFGTSVPNSGEGQVFGNRYPADLTLAGAEAAATRFADDILRTFGAESLSRTRIYFVSDRTGNKEIWRMNHDGSGQEQVTRLRSITFQPAVSSDGRWLAYTTLVGLRYEIRVQPTEGGPARTVGRAESSLNYTPGFSADGKRMYFSSSENGWSNLYAVELETGKLTRLTNVRAVEVQPRVNPKSGDTILFTSDRSGKPQIFSMNGEGLDVARLTSGEGEAVNPAWHPNGQFLAFAWTRGAEPGGFNLFVMDFATRQFTQLTTGEGVSENPVWAPGGRHLAFGQRQGRGSQIWTLLANGTARKQLTSAGSNTQPVWTRKPD